MKPYNIAESDDEAEVNMYGEVVSEIPTDWWGDKIEGMYIVLSDFLNDMERLKSKSKVTFHINSPGGEVFAGISIYNRMKEFKGIVSTVVDGLAASAASIIAQGGTKGHRKVCNGSLTMIHGASSFMFGRYNANELKDSIAQLNAIDKSIAEIYAACTGLDQEKVKSMLTKTTWMSAQDAVNNGFADGITDAGQPVTMSISKDRNILVVNGIPMSVKGFMDIPDYIQVCEEVTAGKHPDVIENIQTGGEKHMTLEELTKQEPELVDQIRNAAIQSAQTDTQQAVSAAVSNELNRLKSIDEIAGKIADKALVERAKYGETKMSAADLALEALKLQNDAGQTFLDNMK
ncbi:MAG: ATP-dependent Clp protease proteolytic subunit, partial [Lachnospiraceae bacterium]|nr:ATP-dependent Clp protease proteolytic subunit [Lachnospiraceae bacterium]